MVFLFRLLAPADAAAHAAQGGLPGALPAVTIIVSILAVDALVKRAGVGVVVLRIAGERVVVAGTAAGAPRRDAGWDEVVQLIKAIEQGGGAPRGHNPLGGAIFDILNNDEVANANPVPAEAVAEKGRHYVGAGTYKVADGASYPGRPGRRKRQRREGSGEIRLTDQLRSSNGLQAARLVDTPRSGLAGWRCGIPGRPTGDCKSRHRLLAEGAWHDGSVSEELVVPELSRRQGRPLGEQEKSNCRDPGCVVLASGCNGGCM